MKTVVTFGTFDLFHYGHLRILERSAALGDKLIVGISTDALNFEKKGKKPVFSELERCEIVKAIRYVDGVFLEHSLDEKLNYLKEHNADVFVMGDDWKGKFDFCSEVCEVKYLPRTDGVSSTDLKIDIKKNH